MAGESSFHVDTRSRFHLPITRRSRIGRESETTVARAYNNSIVASYLYARRRTHVRANRADSRRGADKNVFRRRDALCNKPRCTVSLYMDGRRRRDACNGLLIPLS